LVGFLRQRAPCANTKSENTSQNESNNSVADCPDGECPCCNKKIDAKRIIALSKSKDNGGTVTSTYLADLRDKSSPPARKPFDISTISEGSYVPVKKIARQELDNAVSGSTSSKMTAIMDELTRIWQVDPGSKVLLFSHYLGFLDLLGTQLGSRGIECFRLDGTLSLKERMNVLVQFRSSADKRPSSVYQEKVLPNDDGSPVDKKSRLGQVLLMSMTAGGEGLNLVAASSVFICDPWWNVAKEDQCVNRIHRIGQLADVVRVRKFVVSDSVEERIVELQCRKKHMADEIYDGARGGSDSDAAGSGDGATAGAAKLSLDDFRLIFRK